MTKPLTNLQVELLRSFNYQIDDSQLLEIKKMLTDYFAQKVSDGMDKLFEEHGWDDSKLDEWSGEHMRKPYNK
ncbi:hypothetical protein [Neolewinella antarctica]|uniref:Uncharacterized protein n=1 Tax=Neolewinella antarctica TaxID=442734 RepID=A0ABX0XGP3_9BACT|nr:hypothetical protein [Neolewinella antarctica]NJC28508.1 hypothetical protein [Neolewinella antarctica]